MENTLHHHRLRLPVEIPHSQAISLRSTCALFQNSTAAARTNLLALTSIRHGLFGRPLSSLVNTNALHRRTLSFAATIEKRGVAAATLDHVPAFRFRQTVYPRWKVLHRRITHPVSAWIIGLWTRSPENSHNTFLVICRRCSSRRRPAPLQSASRREGASAPKNGRPPPVPRVAYAMEKTVTGFDTRTSVHRGLACRLNLLHSMAAQRSGQRPDSSCRSGLRTIRAVQPRERPAETGSDGGETEQRPGRAHDAALQPTRATSVAGCPSRFLQLQLWKKKIRMEGLGGPGTMDRMPLPRPST